MNKGGSSVSSSVENAGNDPKKAYKGEKKKEGQIVPNIPKAQQTKENSLNQEIDSQKSNKNLPKEETSVFSNARKIGERKCSSNIKQNLTDKFEQVAMIQSPIRNSRTKNFHSPRRIREVETGEIIQKTFGDEKEK